MIIDCIGCLHGATPKLEGGDLLIVTGDLTRLDLPHQYEDFFHWLKKQNYRKKVFISGNHDNQSMSQFNWGDDVNYLCDSGTEFAYYPPLEESEGKVLERKTFKIWGSPWTASFKGINPHCTAFTMPFGADTEDRLMDKWELIPHDTDILITHSPPFGIRDGIPMQDGTELHVGSKTLYGWLKYVGRPRLHVFSHIHEGYGCEEHFATYDNKMMMSVNCSIMNRDYKPTNKPIRIIYENSF